MGEGLVFGVPRAKSIELAGARNPGSTVQEVSGSVAMVVFPRARGMDCIHLGMASGAQ